jgi:hypothetical protein
MSKGEGRGLKSVLSVGTSRPMYGELRESARQERETFRSCVAGLGTPAGHPWLEDSWVRNRDGGLS